MLRNLLLGATASLLLLGATASRADDQRFYIHGTIGESELDGGIFVRDETDTTLGARFGWRFLPWLAIEAGYSDLGDYQLTCGGEVCPAVVFPRFDIDTGELGLNARVPFGQSAWFGVARAGLHNFDAGFGGSETEPYYGLGIGYQVSPRFAVSLDVDRYETGSSAFDIDRVGLGLQVSF